MASSVIPARRRARALRLSLPLLLVPALAGCDAGAGDDKAASTPPQAVETVTVALEPTVSAWTYVGTVEPRYQSDLGFRVAGKVVARLVEVGERVTKGQTLARLDANDYELSLSAQEAERAAAKTSRDEAEAALGRYRKLFAQGHVSQAALDQRVAAAAEADSRLERAERQVALAANQLSYATLSSDADGVVAALPVEAGQVVQAGQLVARVARLDALEVEVALPEQQVDAVRAADAQVEIWGAASVRLPAALREVAPDADPVSRTFRARFALKAAPGDNVLGRTATVHLSAKSTKTFAALPLSAVSNDGKGAVAWVVSTDGTRAIPKPIDIARVEKDRVLVASGLADGDRVVALGVHMLDPGKPIRPVSTRTASR
jgi:multidrug efflux system membrane fusion protein